MPTYSPKTHLLEKIDHRLGVPVDALLTLIRRASSRVHRPGLAAPLRQILFLSLYQRAGAKYCAGFTINGRGLTSRI